MRLEEETGIRDIFLAKFPHLKSFVANKSLAVVAVEAFSTLLCKTGISYTAVIAKKHVYHNVNKVQITQTFTLIFDLIDIVIYVFLRYNGSIV
jgi:hypothetical protein